MKGTNLGEFEELVLLIVMILGDEAYVLNIKDELYSQVKRSITMGALHPTLTRLEKKGFLTSAMGGATNVRGGRRKRIYQLSAAGKMTLQQAKAQRASLWDQIPAYQWSFLHG